MSGTERQEAARAWQESLAAGTPLSGAQLAERFSRSPRWGRDVIASCRAEGGSNRKNGKRPEGGNPQDTGVVSAPAESPAERQNGKERHVPQAADPPAVPVPAADERQTAATSPWPRRLATLAVLAVAAVAAVSSFAHQMELAEMAGEEWRAALWPISIDGMVLSSSMVLLTRRRAGEPAGALTWLALLAGVGASLAANVAAAEPTLLGRAVAGWSPLALLLSFEMLLRIRRTPSVKAAASGQPPGIPAPIDPRSPIPPSR